MVSVSVSDWNSTPSASQLIFEFQEIFDDAILDNDHAFCLPEMGMCIAGIGRAMCCPARMTDARRAVDG